MDELADRIKEDVRISMAVLDALPVPCALNDDFQNITYLNPAFIEILGYTLEDIPTLSDWWPKAYPDPEYRDWVATNWQARLDKAKDSGDRFEPLDIDIRSKNGNVLKMSVSAAPLIGKYKGTHLVILYDITARSAAEEALKCSKQEWRTLTENSPDIVARYDTDLRRTYANPTFVNTVEGGTAALLGKRPSEFPGGPHTITYEDHLREVLASGEGCQFELFWKVKNGSEVCTQINMTPEFDAGGKVVSVLAIGRDITEQFHSKSELRLANERLANVNHRLQALADRDPLTELFNRRALMQRINQAINFNERNHVKAALLFIDLDSFKTLNDTYGHAIGDLLLQEVARRLTGCVREVDTVSRFGGDEFAVLLNNLDEHEENATAQAMTVAEKTLTNLNQPYLLEGQSFSSTPSIGISVFGGQETDTDQLLKQVDTAMYQAKKAGRNTIYLFSEQKLQQAD